MAARKKAKRARKATRVRKAKRAKQGGLRIRRRRGRPIAPPAVHLTRIAELTQSQPMRLPTYPKPVRGGAGARRQALAKKARSERAQLKAMVTEIGRLLRSKRRKLTVPTAADILRVLRQL